MSRKKPRSRRVRGSGSVFEATRRGVAVWVARLPVGRSATGRTTYREASAATAAEALAKLAKLRPPTTGCTVAEYCQRWLDTIADRRPSTRDSYRVSVEHHIRPTLGHLRLASLTPYHVEAAARTWGDARAVGSVRLTLSHLRVALAAAVREGLIPANPVVSARKPKSVRKSIDPFPPADVRRIIDAATARPDLRAVALLAATGARPGEVVALDVTDYDPLTGLLAITKTWHHRHGVGPAKSSNSVRTIRVPLRARPAVLAAAGRRKRGPLFLGATGARVSASAFVRPWQGLLRALGLKVRNAHQLRHSSITNQLAAGYPPADVAKYHGNSVRVVFAVYCHPTSADPSEGVDKFLG
jgi:integrase